jgi:hypothetical protein
MIEVTYAEMFLGVVILALGSLLVKAKLQLIMHKRLTMLGLEAVLDGEAEIIRKDGYIQIRGVKK